MSKYAPAIIGGVFLVLLLVFIGLKGVREGSTPDKPMNGKQPGAGKSLGGIEMILLPGGSFTMGSDKDNADEGPAHKVELSSFYMDKYEVTQEAYEKLTGGNPAKHKGTGKPVDRITWNAAAKFCNLRSRRDGLTPCYNEETWKCDYSADGYRLPTEAEWEYACRAGTTTTYYFGGDKAEVTAYAWNQTNSGGTTHPVGSRKPNAWGFCDMYGNVAEWVEDFYSDDYYGKSPAKDPRGPESGWRMMRGGSWTDSAESCRSSYRNYNDDPDQTVVCAFYDMYGFRCVRNAKKGSADAAGKAPQR